LPLCFDPVCSHNDESCPAAYLSGNTTFNMACSDDTFYYAVNPTSAASTEILSVDINNASRKVLCNLNNRIFGLKLYNGYLYYIENNADTTNQIYRLKVSGGSPELILDGKNNNNMYDLFCVYADNLYYLKSEHDGLYKYNITNGSEDMIYNGYTSDFFIYGEQIYLKCIDNDKYFTNIYNMNDGTVSELIINGQSIYKNYCVYNDIIYIFEIEEIEYTIPGRDALDSLLADEPRAARDRKTYYYNTTLYSCDKANEKLKEIAYYPMTGFDSYAVYENKLYFSGSFAKDLGNNTISKDDISGYIDLSSGAIKFSAFSS